MSIIDELEAMPIAERLTSMADRFLTAPSGEMLGRRGEELVINTLVAAHAEIVRLRNLLNAQEQGGGPDDYPQNALRKRL